MFVAISNIIAFAGGLVVIGGLIWLARAVIFEDTGHLAMLERPSRFNELLTGFIAGEREPERGVEGVSA